MAEAAPAEKLLENDICRGDRRNDSFPGARRADKKFPTTFTSLPERETIGRFHLVPLWSPSAKETPSKTDDFEITDPPERFFLILSLSLFSRISSLVESAATPSRLPLNERKTLLTNESILFHLGRDYWNTMNERGRGASRESKERARREGRRESERRRGGVERRE